MTPEEIRDFLGVDSVAYLSVGDMLGATGWTANSFCTACFTGDYPLPVEAGLRKDSMERQRRNAGFFGGETTGLFDGAQP